MHVSISEIEGVGDESDFNRVPRQRDETGEPHKGRRVWIGPELFLRHEHGWARRGCSVDMELEHGRRQLITERHATITARLVESWWR